MSDRSFLAAFLKHGRLPFVGREEELAALTRFWRGDDETPDEMRLLLLVAEAGSGKTRLLDEFAAHVRAHGGVALNARLRPEGTASVAALLAAALDASTSATVRRRDPFAPPTVPQLLPELERLCALRRTVLVLEDLHLADAGSHRELAQLLDGVRNLPVVIIAAMRPLENRVRDLAAGHASQEVYLHGLSPDALAVLWTHLFGTAPGAEILAPLVNATHGNALAVRAALRAALRGHDPVRDGKTFTIDTAAFATVAQRTAHAIALGIVADLDPALLRAAQRLALLGEVFTIEGAEAILDGSFPSAIELLVDRGIIAHTIASGRTLNGLVSGKEPLAFTHTLLHAALASEGEHDAEAMAALPVAVSRGIPLLSSLSYSLLRDRVPFETMPYQLLDTLFGELHRAARHILYTVDSHISIVLLEALDKLNGVFATMVESQEQRVSNAINLHLLHISYIHNEVLSTRYLEHLERIEALIDEVPMDERMACFSATALLYRFRRTVVDGEDRDAVHARFDGLLDAYPSIRGTQRHLRYLADRALAASNENNYVELRRVGRIADELLADPMLGEQEKVEVKMRVWPMLLMLLANHEEVAQRRAMMDEIDALFESHVPGESLQKVMYHAKRAQFHSTVGNYDDLVAELEVLIPDLRRYGVIGTMATRMILLDSARRTIHLTPDALQRTQQVLEEIGRDVLPLRHERYRLMAVEHMRLTALLHLSTQLLKDAETLAVGIVESSFVLLEIAAAALHGNWEEFREKSTTKGSREEFDLLVDELYNCRYPLGESAAEALRLRTDTVAPTELNIPDQLTIFLLLVRGAELAAEKGVREAFQSLAADVLRRMLEWHDSRRLNEPMLALLGRYGSLLPARELRRWRAQAEAIAAERRPAAATESNAPLAISMCGEITVQRAGAPPERLRGTRNGILLGLLVVQPLLREPLDRHSFLELASGVERDPDRARVATNIAVLRLREVLGEEAIVQLGDPPVPSLDPTCVRVDLWEGVEAVRRAESALRRGVLAEAREQLAVALSILAGRIALPGLYDELFESMREDLEARLREGTLTAAGRLLAMDDSEGAAELLRPWLAGAPEDEEARDLLAEALRRTGLTADAVAIARAVPQEE